MQPHDENSIVRPARVALVALALAVVVVALFVLLPADLRFVAVIVALIAGIGLERFRQSHLPPPPTLRETPQAWKNVLRYEVGYRQLGIAIVLFAAAAAFLLISFDSGDDATLPTTVGAPPIAGERPKLEVREESANEAFVRDGVKFEVVARRERRSPLFRGVGEADDRLLSVDVAMTNEERARFNPAVLDYRLRPADGSLLGPARSSAVGSESLVRRGTLPEGDRVTQKLVFAVPPKSGDVALEFEPIPNGSVRIRVPLDVG